MRNGTIQKTGTGKSKKFHNELFPNTGYFSSGVRARCFPFYSVGREGLREQRELKGKSRLKPTLSTTQQQQQQPFVFFFFFWFYELFDDESSGWSDIKKKSQTLKENRFFSSPSLSLLLRGCAYLPFLKQGKRRTFPETKSVMGTNTEGESKGQIQRENIFNKVNNLDRK